MSDGTETTPGRLDELFNHTPRQRKHFRWDPTINAGHLISAIISVGSALIMVMTAYNQVDKRILAQEIATTNQALRDAAQDQMVREKFGEVKDSMKEFKDSVNELRRDLRKTP